MYTRLKPESIIKMNYIEFIFISFLFALFSCSILADDYDDEFKYDMTSTCTMQNNGLCTEWKHSGKIKNMMIVHVFQKVLT